MSKDGTFTYHMPKYLTKKAKFIAENKGIKVTEYITRTMNEMIKNDLKEIDKDTIIDFICKN